MPVIDKIAPYAKAFIAAIIALLTGLVSGLVAGGLSWSEILVSLIAFFTGLLAVFRVPNRPPFVPEQPSE